MQLKLFSYCALTANDSFCSRYLIEPFKKACKDRGIHLFVMGFNMTPMALDMIESGHFKDYDTIILLQGDPLLDMYGPIGSYCSENNIAFCANFRGAVRSSAAFGYAPTYRKVGEAAAQLVQKIVFDSQHPSQLETVRLPSNNKLIINTEVAAEQGMDPVLLEEQAGRDALVIREVELFPVPYDDE